MILRQKKKKKTDKQTNKKTRRQIIEITESKAAGIFKHFHEEPERG